MDHFPSIEKAGSLSFVVPYVAGQQYDGKGVSNYPSRRGWNHGDDDFTNDGTRSSRETAADLHKWLYFSMIHDILGDVHHGFVTWDAERSWIVTTCNRSAHLAAWDLRLGLMSSRQRRAEVEKAKTCLLEVDAVIAKHQHLDHVCAWPLIPNVSLSIMLLMEALDEARKFLISKYALRVGPTKPLRYGRIQSLEQQMVQTGWCPNHVNMYRIKFGISAFYYSRLLARPLPKNPWILFRTGMRCLRSPRRQQSD